MVLHQEQDGREQNSSNFRHLEGQTADVDADPSCTVKEFGQLLQDLTSVKPDTLKLIVPQSTNKGSKLITPFSDPHSSLTLNEAAISEVSCG